MDETILTMNDVYFVLELTNNLLSIGELQKRLLVIIIKESACKIYHPQKRKNIDKKMTLKRMCMIRATLKPLPQKS